MRDLPLSDTQHRLWLVHLAGADDRVGNNAAAWRFQGTLDRELLRFAIEQLFHRHAILRAVFTATDGVPRQQVLPPARFALVVDDLSQLPPATRDAEAARRARDLALTSYDLEAGPMLRARLLELAPDDHVLVLATHNIVADCWALGVLWRELATLYRERCTAEQSSLQPATLQYADYAVRQRESLTGEILSWRLAYWEQQLRGAPHDLPLPYRTARSGVVTAAAGSVTAPFEPHTVKALEQLARRVRTTPFMVLVAALRTLLTRYTGCADVCIGTLLADRHRVETKDLIGPLIDPVVLRGKIDGADTVTEVVKRERDLALDAYEHHVAFGRVIDAVTASHPAARGGLIQVLCTDMVMVAEAAALPGLTIEPFPVDVELAEFDLVVHVLGKTTGRLAGDPFPAIRFSFARDLFSEDVIERMAADYGELLAAFLADPARRIDELPTIAPVEQPRSLFEPIDTEVHYTPPQTPTEVALAALWAQVIDCAVETIGGEHSFFTLGGHSLLVMRLISLVSRELDVELAPRAVFEAPTLAAQAALIDEAERGGRARDDAAAERALAAQVASWSDAEVAARHAQWSAVALAVRPVATTVAGQRQRRELLERLVAQHRIDCLISQPLARRASATSPATFTQRRMWDLHALDDILRLGSPRAYAIRGHLDAEAMQRAVTALVARQAALRTVFELDGDQLTETAHERGPALAVADLSACTADQRLLGARAQFDAIGQPHDLRREAFRAVLVRLGADDHLLILATHHVVFDGFSEGVLWSDLPALYRAAVSGQAAELPPLDFEFRDFCFWQTTLEDRPVGKRELAFWADAITNYDALELSSDLPTPPTPRGAGLEVYVAGSLPFVIDGATWDALTARCDQLRVVPYSVVITAFFLFVARCAGRSDALGMSGSHLRNRPGSEKLIGNFLTPYPFRIAFDERATIEDTLRHGHQVVLAHREHQSVGPRSALPRWSEVTRYNVNYQIVAADARPRELEGATVEPLGWSSQPQPCRTIHDLALLVSQADAIRGEFVYNAERFSPERGRALGAGLGELIQLIVTEPSRVIGTLPRWSA